LIKREVRGKITIDGKKKKDGKLQHLKGGAQAKNKNLKKTADTFIEQVLHGTSVPFSY
jgi:uncharacterized protein YjbJ (UPF0337 family)